MPGDAGAQLDALRAALDAHLRNGRLADAEAVGRDLLHKAPGDAPVLHRLAVIARARGRVDEAERWLQAGLRAGPEDADILAELGTLRYDQGGRDEAAAYFSRALHADPLHARAHHGTGQILLDRGDVADAVASFRRAVDANPRYPGAWNDLGVALDRLGDRAGGEACFQTAVNQRPTFADAHLNLGTVRLRTDRPAAALPAFREAIRLSPCATKPHFQLARCLLALGRADEALSEFREVLRLDPGHGRARLALAAELAHIGRTDEAITLYEEERRRRPQSLMAALGAELTLPMIYTDRAASERARARFTDGLSRLGEALPSFLGADRGPLLSEAQWTNFFLAYQGEDDGQLQEAYGDLIGRVLDHAFADAPVRWPNPEANASSATTAGGGSAGGRRISGRRLRIGYVSSFFRDCTVGRYFKSWITRADPALFDRFVYHIGGRADHLTAEIDGAAERSFHLAGGIADIAAAIRCDAPDILVYPELGMEPRTFLLAGLRLASVQCAAWGHPVTSGLANIDYFLSCAEMEPPGAQEHYRERLVTLPGIGTSYDRPRPPEPKRRSDFGLPEDRTLYLFPQSLFKIHPDNDVLLARILSGDPNAVLVLFGDRHPHLTETFLARLDKVLVAHGLVAGERRFLLPMMPHEDYLRVNGLCDVMLDSLYWSGGNTSLDALAADLPIVTLPGRFMRGRQSAAMLRQCGLVELIAHDEADFVDRALRLGLDSAWRTEVRGRLAKGSEAVFGQAAPVESLAQFFRDLPRVAAD